MTRGQRTIACLLTVVAVLLAVNLVAGGAGAQPTDSPRPSRTLTRGQVVGMHADQWELAGGHGTTFYRIWSNGKIEEAVQGWMPEEGNIARNWRPLNFSSN